LIEFIDKNNDIFECFKKSINALNIEEVKVDYIFVAILAAF